MVWVIGGAGKNGKKKQMNRAKWIKQIIGKEAEELGFSYAGSHSSGYSILYYYENKAEEFEENIFLYIHKAMIPILYSGVRMTFRRTGMGIRDIEANHLLESNYISDGQGFIPFNSEEEFREILEHLAQIIREKGKKTFDSMKPVKEGYPRREMHWKLYQEHEQLNQKYRKLYGLEDTEFMAKLMRQLIKIIVENWDREFKEVEELLIGLAAIYGDQLIRKCGGWWEWDEGVCSSCRVWGLHGTEYRGTIPLNVITHCWGEKVDRVENLLENFRKMHYDTVI